MRRIKLSTPEFVKRNKWIILILFLSLFFRFLFFLDYHMIWWDSAVYIGMGKYVFSLGRQGLWEPIRPILWPILLGFLWKLKLDPVFFGRLLNIIMSAAIVYLSYYITKRLYDEKTALIASILVSFSSILFFYNYRLYTEIPALLFVLLAFFFYLNDKYFLTGLFLSLSFLTKFPAGIFILPFTIIIFWQRKTKKIPFFFYGLILPVLPYLILNQKLYSNALMPFTAARMIITQVLGCTVLRYQPWYSYFVYFLKDNALNFFAVFGIYHAFKIRDQNKTLLISLFFLPLAYFMHLSCREYRYIIIFLPFLSVLTADGIIYATKRIKQIKKKHFLIILASVIAVSLIFSLTYYFFNESRKPIAESEDFYRFAEGQAIPNEVWITNPIVGLYLPKKADLLYYPLYDVNTIFNFQHYVQTNNVTYIFLDTCGGGMTCDPGDDACSEKTREFIDSFPSYGFKVFYNKTFGVCNYIIFRK